MKERHEQILNFIKSYYTENGCGPTVREIGDGVGLKSTSSVQSHLQAMEDAGLIIRGDFSTTRSIRIPGFGYQDNSSTDGILYVLHGYWSLPDDDGVNIYGVSHDKEKLVDLMYRTGETMVEDALDSPEEICLDDIKTGSGKYEAENTEGYFVRLYITEHGLL